MKKTKNSVTPVSGWKVGEDVVEEFSFYKSIVQLFAPAEYIAHSYIHCIIFK